MINIALYEPEIPPNTGNIIRLCANVGANLHLIEPLGFKLEDKQLRRAGLDYHEFANLKIYKNFGEFYQKNKTKKIWACTTKAKQYYHQVDFDCDDILLFGPETRGLPAKVLELLKDTQIKIPMYKNSRSLNLSNSVAVILYGALNNIGFESLDLL
ncbi:tRNA (uridine(34)/cytosine(34)/5-carboxymethylaminomethyluridine(34)-2'-O)-methyltransferase TrmL [Allofrancisella guangzhouensis]|uniref:tRNA (cytidine(34)-2'-O)-methyltransferase n=1 Tax=Allofrancisella guangzhouensis TaxID=594679 RepID=A0A0A8E728_9GAMM|nr:tRNA (uridine(34)/cytosine(34)/5-carboxymethylaminomethyluridine(34)-2'-O)-methyltransferase TrmL [Allofrancisella guangzhouensis]AJC49407.1 rRNA methylase [Allofrancisella guangzhouensis]MBK2026697.1 tRNA (uridine(34)/cytosine(34)/5-carboxymethylaminomethyluridine(34)-2'-O)-methyltransferase TrmL [Allofrancisella guangzhouensis]MBK2043961.1 tRNA (uridine(34)/cytosine(34)/5-carboxymethylaminomethyluridine(34)-2'-O)-methyltransferase TrmL [Allofrancisella guangzhouensis]MBK2046223.1 tRNA (uri